MAQSNPNDTKLEQQRSDAAEASLKNQTEGNSTEYSEAAADRIAENAKDSKQEK